MRFTKRYELCNILLTALSNLQFFKIKVDNLVIKSHFISWSQAKDLLKVSVCAQVEPRLSLCESAARSYHLMAVSCILRKEQMMSVQFLVKASISQNPLT